jgi:tetratricopeptide (TPR) repeat protein
VLDEAEVLLKKAEKANPDSPWTLLARARVATSRGMRTRDDTDAKALASAKALVDRAETLAPKLGAVHVRRAWVLLSSKEYASARAAAQRALDLDPDDVDAEIISARIANADHAPEEAERRLFRVVPKIRLRATLALAYGDLIDAAVALHEYRRADALYRAAIELVPESAWQKGNYAGFLVWRREYTRAAEVAKSAIAQLDYSAARWALANAYVGEGIVLLWDRNDPEAARRYFDAALVENPRNADAHYGLAAYHRVRAVRERSPTEATAAGKELRETLRIDPKHWAAQKATADQPALEAAARGA